MQKTRPLPTSRYLDEMRAYRLAMTLAQRIELAAAVDAWRRGYLEEKTGVKLEGGTLFASLGPTGEHMCQRFAVATAKEILGR